MVVDPDNVQETCLTAGGASTGTSSPISSFNPWSGSSSTYRHAPKAQVPPP